MTVPIKHLLHQGPVLAALGRAVIGGLRAKPNGKPQSPGPWIEMELPPRPEALVRDYVRNVGGDPAWYRGTLPAHLFSEWGFPLAARAMEQLPYPLTKVINAGCSIQMSRPIPANEPLLVRARIESIDEDERRVLVTQRIVTGTNSAPEATTSDLRVFIPLGKPGKSNGGSKEKPRVPKDAREIAFLKIGADAGLDFAKLTGDINPIHWLLPYAKAAGFRACILHGFGTLARAVEAMNRTRFAGDPTRLRSIDVRFTRPLVLPARVGIYLTEAGVWVGDAPGGGAYLEGSYKTETER